MSPLKPLNTERLILNEITQDDAAFYLTLFGQDEVMKYYGGQKFTQLEESKAWILRVTRKYIDQTGCRYAIRLPLGQAIGSFGINRILQDEGKTGIVIGYDLHPDFWQKGYMSEVLSSILNELKKYPLFSKKIDFVLAEVFDGNEGSMQLLRKHGFIQDEAPQNAQIRFGLEHSEAQLFKLELRSY